MKHKGMILLALALVAVLAGNSYAKVRKVMATFHASESWGNGKRCVKFYDVTELGDPGVTDVFGAQSSVDKPMFCVWVGPENVVGGFNYEEVTGMTLNPATGTTYQLSYDSSGGTNDNGSDYDLYRMNYAQILKHWEANYANLPNKGGYGVIYGPTLAQGAFADVDHPDAGTATEHVTGIEKLAELSRNMDTAYWDTSMSYVSPEKILIMDNGRAGADTLANDHDIRGFTRTSKSPSGNGTETWASTRMGQPWLDPGGNTRSDVEDMVYVKRDGVEGVWVQESDGGSTEVLYDGNGDPYTLGDDIAFFEIDWNTMTATRKELKPTAGTTSPPWWDYMNASDDPTSDPYSNDGSVDWIDVDADGNLIISESGYYDDPAGPNRHQPKTQTVEVNDYDNPDSDSSGADEVELGSWSMQTLTTPTDDDDDQMYNFDTGTYDQYPAGSEPADGRFHVIDKDKGWVYYFDDDYYPNEGDPDVYVMDMATGAIIYEEIDAIIAGYPEEKAFELFVRGDMTGDHRVTADDIDSFFDVFHNGTAADKEGADLTGDYDMLFDGSSDDDMVELVENILESGFGDADLDKDIDATDLASLGMNWDPAGTSDVGWATGDFDGDGDIDATDLATLGMNWAPAGVNPIPEPATMSLLALGGLALIRRKR